jgi:ParB family chromosome partitioning protein
MTETRRGLGRGLSALLDEADAAQGGPQGRSGGDARGGVDDVPIELIRRNADQPRRAFPDEEMDELAASIREKGILQPILVRPLADTDGQFQIVAGERRWRAAQRAGLKTIPALIRDLDDLAVMEIALVENIQRTDLNPIEEARGYQAMVKRFSRSQETIAKIVGKSRSHVANAIRLLHLDPVVQEHLEAGRLTAGHARALMGATDPGGLARQIIDRALSVREAEALAKRVEMIESGFAKPPAPKLRTRKDADTLALETDLAEVLGLAVEVRDKGGAGELRIKYQTLEQLDDLCRRLSGGAA